MSRSVKGTLFVDYVRMLRARKGVDWSQFLRPEDMPFLSQRIAPDDWYPMDTFERMGLAILAKIKPGLDLVRAWGYAQVDWLCHNQPDLVVPGNAEETLERFRVHRGSFFDFPALEIAAISHGKASVRVTYGMSGPAEEAASYQTLGLFQRLIELSGAKDVEARFSAMSWAGQGPTVIELSWTEAEKT